MTSRVDLPLELEIGGRGTLHCVRLGWKEGYNRMGK